MMAILNYTICSRSLISICFLPQKGLCTTSFHKQSWEHLVVFIQIPNHVLGSHGFHDSFLCKTIRENLIEQCEQKHGKRSPSVLYRHTSVRLEPNETQAQGCCRGGHHDISARQRATIVSGVIVRRLPLQRQSFNSKVIFKCYCFWCTYDIPVPSHFSILESPAHLPYLLTESSLFPYPSKFIELNFSSYFCFLCVTGRSASTTLSQFCACSPNHCEFTCTAAPLCLKIMSSYIHSLPLALILYFTPSSQMIGRACREGRGIDVPFRAERSAFSVSAPWLVVGNCANQDILQIELFRFRLRDEFIYEHDDNFYEE